MTCFLHHIPIHSFIQLPTNESVCPCWAARMLMDPSWGSRAHLDAFYFFNCLGKYIDIFLRRGMMKWIMRCILKSTFFIMYFFDIFECKYIYIYEDGIFILIKGLKQYILLQPFLDVIHAWYRPQWIYYR